MRKLIVALFAAAAVWPAAAAIPAAVQSEVIEFYHKDFDHYFITADPKEIQDLDTGVHTGWTRTGYRFPSIKLGAEPAATTPVCRFYGRPEAKLDSHFYSSKLSECDDVKRKFPEAWQFESEEVFRAYAVDPQTGRCPSDTIPVYRLWNQRPDVNHRYTDQLLVFKQMLAKGYKAEGDGNPNEPVAFCTPAGGSVVPPPPAGSPACTLAASSAAPALGTTLTLTATCTGAPTSYLWSGCTSTTNVCQTTQTTAGVASYTVFATNGQGTGAPVTIPITWGGLTGPTPACTIAASTTNPTAGGFLTLTASCSLSPSKFNWFECSYLIPGLCALPIANCAAGTSTCTFSTSTAGFARYGVSGTGAGGTGAVATIEVNWGGSGGTPPPPPAVPSCSLNPSNNNPATGSTITLTATCFGSPTSYEWTNVSCPASSSSCNVSQATPGTTTYFVAGINSAGKGPASSAVVVWGPPPAPVCTVAASNLTPTVGQTITISSSCIGGPTSYAWTGCTSTTSSCTDASTVTGFKTYTLVASSGSGTGAPASVQVNWQAAPTAAPSCTVSPSATTAFTGQPVTLTANCTQSPTSFAWSPGCSISATGNTCTTTSLNVGPQTYTVTASNVPFGAGAASPPVTVTWQQSTAGSDFCPGLPNVVRKSMLWGTANNIIDTIREGPFMSNGTYVVSFVAQGGPYATNGRTDVSEFAGPPIFREMTLSKSSCDFRAVDPSGVNGPIVFTGGSSSLSLAWDVAAAPANLVPGTTYHFNIRNNDFFLGNTCSISSCEARITVNFPY